MDERQPADELASMGAPASPDALKEIVSRHQRTRTRTLGVALAVVLVAGPVAGWAVGQSGGGGQQLATGSRPNAPASGAADNNVAAPAGGGGSAPGFAYGEKNPPKATHLFNRTSSDGIVIRAYRVDPPAPPSDSPATPTPSVKTQEAPCPMPARPGVATATANANSGASASASASSGSSGPGQGSSEGGQVVSPPAPPAPDEPPGVIGGGAPPPCGPIPPACNPTPSVLAEVSDDAAVGQSFDPIDAKQPSDPLSHLSIGVFGVQENSPAVFVTVQTGPGVATVRLRLPSGETDQMAPSRGVAVLAHRSPVPPPSGTAVEALDTSGKVMASTDVTQQGPTMAIACAFAGGPVRAKPVPPTTR